jgi:chromosome segregation ATPase
MASKNEDLKEARDLIDGMEELFQELSKEVHVAQNDRRKAESNVSLLKERAARAHRNYIEHKLLSAELKDEVREGELTTLELQMQVDEFSETIDYLYERLEEGRADFDAVVQYIDKYYMEELDRMKPKMIAKHLVMNRSGKGDVHFFLIEIFIHS